jgi:TonB-linked SusC/RagA family outer membrane protein
MFLHYVRDVLRPLLSVTLGLAMAAFGAEALQAQAVGSIAGTVTDPETNDAVPVVQVSVLGTTSTSLSGQDGRYIINNVPVGSYTLVVQRIGFAEVRVSGVVVTAGQTTLRNLTIRMQPLQMEEIVVTGLIDPIDGARSPITVARVTRENMPIPVLGSPIQNLQGQVSGVTVARGSGEPGSSAAIRLRSSTLLPAAGLDTNPLIVVDGVILGAGGSIDIEAMDIASMEIVKGAAAASLYGSRAANGIIAITTNRGTGLEQGTTQFTVRSEFGFQSAFEGLGLPTHHSYRMTPDGTSYADTLGNPVSRANRVLESPASAARQFLDNPYPTTIFDNLNNAFQGGRVQQHTVSFAQNTATTNYAISLNRNVESGTIPGSDGYQRNSFRVNLDHRFRTNLALSISAFHSRSTTDNVNVAFGTLYSALPDVDITAKDADGNFLQTPDPNDDYENPLWTQAIRDETERAARTLASANVTWDPLQWMNFRVGASYDRRDTDNLDYWPIGFPTIGTFDSQGDGSISYNTDLADAWNAEAQVSLRRDFGPLNTRITARGIFERERNESVDANASVLQIEGVKTMDAALATDQRSNSSETETRTNGYLLDAALDYSGKYIVTALGRRDDSSVFGPDEREHYYYRIGGAWRLGEESWFGLPGFSEFKLSAARGTAGGRPGFNAQYEVWTLQDGVATKTQLGNRNLKPSLTTENEVSLEAVVLDRFGVELTHAWQVSEDQLYQVPLLAFTGYANQWQNGGTIEGRTTELSIQAQLIQTRSFGWSSTFVADRSTSRIAEWPFPCTNPAWLFRCEGRGLYEIWGVRWLDSAERLLQHDGGRITPDSTGFFDINDDGLVVYAPQGNQAGAGADGLAGTSDDLWGTQGVVAGRTYDWGMPIVERDATGATPRQQIGDGTHYNLGFINSFTFGALSLHAQLNAKIGGDAVNSQHQGMVNPRHRAPMEDQFGRPEGLKKPLQYFTNLYNGASASTYFVEDGSYLKLRVLSVSYRVPPAQLARFGFSRMGVTSMQVGLIGRDLLTFSNFRGFDPEQGLAVTGAAQTAGSAYPPSKTFTAEIQLTF